MRCESCGVELAFEDGLCRACLADAVELDVQVAESWSPRYRGTGARLFGKKPQPEENEL